MKSNNLLYNKHAQFKNEFGDLDRLFSQRYSKESIARGAAKRKGQKRTEEYKQKQSILLTGNTNKKGKVGYKLSEESRKNQSVPRTEEHKEKVSKFHKGKTKENTEFVRRKAKTYSLNNNKNIINLTKAKLNEKQINEIYQLAKKRKQYIKMYGKHLRPYPIMTYSEIAEKYNCSGTFIFCLLAGKSKTFIIKNK
jgi:hypothetical protein